MFSIGAVVAKKPLKGYLKYGRKFKFKYSILRHTFPSKYAELPALQGIYSRNL